MSGSGVLLQRANSVESISHVDTVCMDKTGTITTNKLVFEQSFPFIEPVDAEHIASVFATTTGSRNRTIIAIEDKYGNTPTQRAELEWLLCNRPLEYAQLVLGGEMEHYLSLGCDHGRLED